MPTPPLPNRVLRVPAVGARASFSRTFTEGDVALFIGVTWDVNPYHTDDTFAAQTRFGKRIAPGLLTASLFTHVGGLSGFLATEMRFEFVGPVYIGDTITAEMEITEFDEARRAGRMVCRAVRQDGVEVLRASVSGRFPPAPVDGKDG
jgi:3-hydroxybutyryl-CoA dehydratase